MLIIALLIIDIHWKLSRCPSTVGWIYKLWCIHELEYYATMKINGGSLHIHMKHLQNSAESLKQVVCFILKPHICAYMCVPMTSPEKIIKNLK